MSTGVIAAIVGGVTGVITGALSGLVAPWAQWGIEKRRGDRASRQILLRDWREGIADLAGYDGDFDDLWEYSFMQTWLLTLRPYTANDVDDRINAELKADDIDGRQAAQHIASVLSDEVDRIQKKWKLP